MGRRSRSRYAPGVTPRPETLRGPRVLLRAVERRDLPRLVEILREPEVARHWSEPDDAFDQQELLAGDEADGALMASP